MYSDIWLFRPFNHRFNDSLASTLRAGNCLLETTATSRSCSPPDPDVARYISYVLTQLPPEQLKNRSFAIAGDNKVRLTSVSQTPKQSFNEIFKAYEEKTGKKLPISELDARMAANPEDTVAFLHKHWATDADGHSSGLATTCTPTGIHRP